MSKNIAPSICKCFIILYKSTYRLYKWFDCMRMINEKLRFLVESTDDCVHNLVHTSCIKIIPFQLTARNLFDVKLHE